VIQGKGLAQGSDADFYMSSDSNQTWLVALKSLEKIKQINLIHSRFFKVETTQVESADLHAPLIVVNGVFLDISSKLKDRSKNKLKKLLAEGNIDEISVLDKKPSDWGLDKAFSGVILIAVSDERIFKKIFRIRLK
jgi:hypothetical protein